MAEHNMARRIILRRDVTENWEARNPVLMAGELGVDLDLKNIKLGDGETEWNQLEFILPEFDLSIEAIEDIIEQAIGALNIPDIGDLATEQFVSEAISSSNFHKIFETDNPTEEENGRILIDLNRQIHILNDNFVYRLPDGEEGQIIYFVPKDESDNQNIEIEIDNLRRAPSSEFSVSVSASVKIFYNSDDGDMKNVVTAIFTEGAWNLSGGEIT